MQELEKILEEIKDELKDIYLDIANNYNISDLQYDGDKVACVASKFRCDAGRRIEKIIRNHMNDGWVSVEERVPKEEGYKVLVCSKKGNIDTGIYSPYTKQWFIGNISALGKDIIAWRPLPEPYHPERSEHDR